MRPSYPSARHLHLTRIAIQRLIHLHHNLRRNRRTAHTTAALLLRWVDGDLTGNCWLDPGSSVTRIPLGTDLILSG